MFTTIDDFLPSNLSQSIYTHCLNLRWSYNWTSNLKLTTHKHWNFDFGGSKIYNTLDITKKLISYPIIVEAWGYIKNTYLPNHKLIRCYANGYTFGTEGYPHTDSVRKDDITTIVYITQDWLREWGGETIIFDNNNIVHSVLPAYNRALMFNSNLWHCARSVTRLCDQLRIVLVFKSTPVMLDPKRDQLQIFLERNRADRLPHNKGYLIDHLLKTYDYLKVSGHSETICLAGGLHSIFGTTLYDEKCLDESYTEWIQNFAGKEALELIKKFSILDRPNILEQYLNQTEKNEQFDNLCLIEAANLAEQNGLSKYPKLTEIWENTFKPHLKQ